jgi:hypothetical protein
MAIQAIWYLAKNDSRHVRQVVAHLPPKAEVPPRVANLVSDLLMMPTRWATAILFMEPESKGPFIFAKATDVVKLLKRKPVRVAFAFYRLDMGGIFQIFVHVDSPEVQAKFRSPYIVENAYWPDRKEHCELIQALIQRENLEVCFVAAGEYGPLTGYFGLAAGLPLECREILKREWEGLLTYHNGIPASRRNFKGALNQYNRENPLEQNPILGEKRWWQFWS